MIYSIYQFFMIDVQLFIIYSYRDTRQIKIIQSHLFMDNKIISTIVFVNDPRKIEKLH